MDINVAKKLVKEYHPKIDLDVLNSNEILSIAKRIQKFLDNGRKK